jgi:hypothetical protein
MQLSPDIAADIPRGFSYYTTLTTINFFESSSVIFAGCVSIYPKSNIPTAVQARANDTDLTTTTITGPVTMWGQPVMVEFQKEDLSLFSTSTSTSSSTTASPSATRTQPAATSPVSATPSTKPNIGLSTGAKVGIGVGVAIAVLLLLGVGIFFLRRKRKARSSREIPVEPLERLGELYAEDPGPKELYDPNVTPSSGYREPARRGLVGELEG